MSDVKVSLTTLLYSVEGKGWRVSEVSPECGSKGPQWRRREGGGWGEDGESCTVRIQEAGWTLDSSGNHTSVDAEKKHLWNFHNH